jgi:hypothetical protein
MAFVEFVEDEDCYSGQRRAFLHLAQEDAFGDVEDAGVARRDVFEPVLETDFAAQLDSALLRDALGEQTRGQSARLQNDDAAGPCESVIEQVLRNLRRFAGAGRGLDDDAVLAAQNAGEIAAQGNDGEGGGIQEGNLATKEHKERKKEFEAMPFLFVCLLT